MKLIKFAVVALIISGCSMSYEGVKEAEKKCTDKGLRAERVSSTVTKTVHSVYCVDDRGNTFSIGNL